MAGYNYGYGYPVLVNQDIPAPISTQNVWLKKTALSGWTTPGIAGMVLPLTTGDSFKWQQEAQDVTGMVVFNTVAGNSNWGDAGSFGFHINAGGQIQVYDAGLKVWPIGAEPDFYWADGDVLEVRRVGSVLSLYQNDVLIHATDTGVAATPFVITAAISLTQGIMKNFLLNNQRAEITGEVGVDVDTPPKVTSLDTFTVDEEQLVVGTVVTERYSPSLPIPSTMLNGGVDVALFDITNDDITFLVAPDYEDPTHPNNQLNFGVEARSNFAYVNTPMVVKVTNISIAPTATDDVFNVLEGQITILDIAANDVGLDAPLDLTSIVITSQPAQGNLVVNNDGTVTYTNTSSGISLDVFLYTIADQTGTVSSIATVVLSITGVLLQFAMSDPSIPDYPANAFTPAAADSMHWRRNEDGMLENSPAKMTLCEGERATINAYQLDGALGNSGGGTKAETSVGVWEISGLLSSSDRARWLIYIGAYTNKVISVSHRIKVLDASDVGKEITLVLGRQGGTGSNIAKDIILTAEGEEVTAGLLVGAASDVDIRYQITGNDALVGNVEISEIMIADITGKAVQMPPEYASIGTPASLKDILYNTSSSWGNAGARSTQTLTGDGEFSCTSNKQEMMIGLSTDGLMDAHFNSIDYAIYCRAGDLQVFELGFQEAAYGSYLETDILSIRRESAQITYLKNGVVFHTSGVASAGTLSADVSFNFANGEITNAEIGGEFVIWEEFIGTEIAPRHLSTNIDGAILRTTYLDDVSVDANGVVTRTGNQTDIPEADRTGISMRGSSGNKQSNPIDINAWNNTDSLATDIPNRYLVGERASQILAGGLTEGLFDDPAGVFTSSPETVSWIVETSVGLVSDFVIHDSTLAADVVVVHMVWATKVATVTTGTATVKATEVLPDVWIVEATYTPPNAGNARSNIIYPGGKGIAFGSIYFYGTMVEESPVRTVFTDLTSTTATNGWKAALAAFKWPDSEGSLEMELTFDHDWADLPNGSHSLLAVRGSSFTDILFMEPQNNRLRTQDGTNTVTATLIAISLVTYKIKVYWKTGGTFNLSVDGVKSVAQSFDGSFSPATFLEYLRGYVHGGSIKSMQVFPSAQGEDTWLEEV